MSSENQKPKFCVDCKHHRIDGNKHMCNAPKGTYNLVTGQEIKYYHNCDALRSHKDCCGPEGKWWIKREE